MPKAKRQPQRSETITDPAFGRLEWDDDFDWWNTDIEFMPGLDIELSIFGHSLDAAKLERRRADFTRLQQQEAALRQAIAKDKLSLANQWRDEGEEPEPITLESLEKRLRLTSILFYEDDTAELFYDDDDIFVGHVLLANLDPKGNLQSVTIAG